ncbi:MAG: hypothetical protein E7316_02455 [Clostridiales bacterium]|nr:hypothetical protein [Clostridiales bacterium]
MSIQWFHVPLVIIDLTLVILLIGSSSMRRKLRNNAFQLFYKTCSQRGYLQGIRDAINGKPLDESNIPAPSFSEEI